MEKTTKAEACRARSAFRQGLIICLAILLGCHCLELSGVFNHDYPPQALRKHCTIAYFAALIGLCALMGNPRGRYMRLIHMWRFEDCPPTIEKSWREYLFALDRAVKPLSILLAAFILCTALTVLAQWYPSLFVLKRFYRPLWWITSLALLFTPWILGNRINEARQRRRFLREQLVSSKYKPRAGVEVASANEVRPTSPVEIRGPRRFWAGGIEWDWEDFYKSCIVLGQPGSGKTISVLNALLDGLIGSASTTAGEECSALILDPKGDYRQKIVTVCRQRGRLRDLVVINPRDPRHSIHWNPFDSTDPDFEIAERFAGAMETLGMKGGDTSFWIDSAKKFIRHAVNLLRLTKPPDQPPTLIDVVRLAGSFSALAERTDALDVRDPRCEAPLQFFGEEWIELAPETRTSVQAHITNMLDPFLTEPYRTLFTGRSTMRIGEMLDRGKILYVDMPLATMPAMGRMLGTLLKLEFFSEVLRRLDNPRPSLFFCDEFQAFFTYGKCRGDADFFDKSRQSNHANVIATQNISGLLKQCQRREHAETLLGLCQVKVFLRNTDHATNEYASQLFGESIEVLGGLAGQAAGGGIGHIQAAGLGQNGLGHWGRNIRPERFTELAIPSRMEQVRYAESLLHFASRAELNDRPGRKRWEIHPIMD